MSWQATAWAVKQVTGSPRAKLTLLTMANYCDDTGCCWPSQETLARETEQSVDTVQREIKKLIKAGLVKMVTRPQGRGRWAGRTYFLNLSVAEMSKPQSAAWPEGEHGSPNRSGDPVTMPLGDRDHAANEPPAMPQSCAVSPCRIAVRHEPSSEPSLEPSLEASSVARAKKPKPSAAERQKAFREGRKGIEVIQNRIAQKLGFDGWAILQSLRGDDLEYVTKLEERRQLDANALDLMRSHYQLRQRSTAVEVEAARAVSTGHQVDTSGKEAAA
jgi:hypothetical protein